MCRARPFDSGANSTYNISGAPRRMQSDWDRSSRGLTTILTLVGAAVVAVFQGAIGLLYGAVLGFLFAQVLHLRSWVSTLHAQVQYLRKEAQQRAMAPEQAKSATPETPAPTATPARATQAPSAEQPSPQPSVSVERPATAAAQERPSAPRSEPSRVPVYTRVHTPVEPSA